VKGHHGSSWIDLSMSALRILRGARMSAPWWILFPIMTPAGIMSMALALQRLERNVLVSGRDGPADVALVEDHRAPGALCGR
jgi:hypothetical protein